ncbi:MAG TPA: hypothetical protein VFZ73_05510 [Gemmatimonadaceae bacterium]
MRPGNQGKLDVRFAYYLLQIRTELLDDSVRFSGVIESLGTGEQTPFAELDDLPRILSGAEGNPPRAGAPREQVTPLVPAPRPEERKPLP